jgi:hypothetical protein
MRAFAPPYLLETMARVYWFLKAPLKPCAAEIPGTQGISVAPTTRRIAIRQDPMGKMSFSMI